MLMRDTRLTIGFSEEESATIHDLIQSDKDSEIRSDLEASEETVENVSVQDAGDSEFQIDVVDAESEENPHVASRKLLKNALHNSNFTGFKFVRTFEKDSTSTRHDLADAESLYNNQNYDNAISLIGKVIEISPGNSYAYLLLGNTFFRKQNYEKAIDAYKKVIDLDPKDERAYENLGIVYAKQGKLDNAIEQWRNVLRLSPHRDDIKKSVDKARHLRSHV
ncbi:MAG: tetratricopeptide repeat protein [candidate division KSB1 bacterium]|nr:tetratricopeptide repeat protein [candidate division KSB1 bacterium]